jgi:peptidoglycan/LPS O-acetylase OafA/YrhL
MVGGLFVHGYAWLPHTHLFFVVEIVSQAFRMGVYFALSGFLSAVALRRTSPGPWLSRRLRQLGIPAMTGVLVLSPLVWWLANSRPHTVAGEPPLIFDWLHTWFLWGLLTCSAALWLLDRRDPAGRWIDLARRRQPGELILGVALATLVMFAIMAPLLRAALPPEVLAAYCNVQLIAGYVPTFMFGVLLARSEELRDRVLDAWRASAAIVIVASLFYCLVCLGLANSLEPYVRFVGASICPPAVFVLVLRSALGVRRLPALVRSLSNASYSIYLLHVPVAVAINTRMASLRFHPNLQYALTVVIAGGGCWLFHIAAVRRSGTLALLLNGRVPRARSPASAPLAGLASEATA